jgi:hypothetical protein
MGELAKSATPLSPWEREALGGSARVLQGDTIKFRDGRYYIGKEQRQASDDWKLGVVDLRSFWVRWEDGQPAEHIEQTPNDTRERNDLGYLDTSQWEEGLNGPQDPWQDVRYLYLIDPKTAQTYTFVTQTFGGRSGIAQLASQIARVQAAQPGALPFVNLRWSEMPTRFGKKTKPYFEVVGWTQGVGGPAQAAEPDPSRGKMSVESGRALSSSELDDDIPFAPEWR